ncbi:MAG: Uncharacterised protein [Gammaproteobacteria bacterium]|nr:MAG: Uncharacterised protein [Gammaproteobacteria bacterium]
MPSKKTVVMGISFAHEVGHKRFEVIKVLVEKNQKIQQHQPVMIVLPIDESESSTKEAITLKAPLAGFISTVVPVGTKTSAPNSVVISITGNKKNKNLKTEATVQRKTSAISATTSSDRSNKRSQKIDSPLRSPLTIDEAQTIEKLQSELSELSANLDQELIAKESWTNTGNTKRALFIWLGLCALTFIAGGKEWGLIAFAIGFMYLFIPLAFGLKTDGELRRGRHREQSNDETLIRQQITKITNNAYQRNRKQLSYWQELKGRDLEVEVAKLLNSVQNLEMEVTKGSGDEGIDLLGYRNDALALVCQVKGWSKLVGQPIVREFLGSSQKYGPSVTKMLIGTSGFTSPAINFADEHEIELITAQDLVRLARNKKRFP